LGFRNLQEKLKNKCCQIWKKSKNDNYFCLKWSFWVKIILFCEFDSGLCLITVTFFWGCDKSRDSTAKSLNKCRPLHLNLMKEDFFLLKHWFFETFCNHHRCSSHLKSCLNLFLLVWQMKAIHDHKCRCWPGKKVKR
jgi:hypothetical protein